MPVTIKLNPENLSDPVPFAELRHSIVTPSASIKKSTQPDAARKQHRLPFSTTDAAILFAVGETVAAEYDATEVEIGFPND